eukprot:jgi/Mesvir1/24163/Mv10880-RA.1
MYEFMKTGLTWDEGGASSTITSHQKDVVMAIICNILKHTCERSDEFLRHNPEFANPKLEISGLLHRALLAESMTHMDRPGLEEELYNAFDNWEEWHPEDPFLKTIKISITRIGEAALNQVIVDLTQEAELEGNEDDS